jgi:hypothetical protein
MAETQFGGTDRAIRWTTTLSVIALVAIAAIVSYKHMVLSAGGRYGGDVVDRGPAARLGRGMIATVSMSLLLGSAMAGAAAHFRGRCSSLAVPPAWPNVAIAEPSAIGRLIAGWSSCALIGSYELLMRQIRTGTWETKAENIGSYASQTASEPVHAASEESRTHCGTTTARSYEALTSPVTFSRQP